MADSGWIGELVKLGGAAAAFIIPIIWKWAMGVFAFAKHPTNWPNGLQFQDYEIVSLAVAEVCDKNACPGLLECADFSDIGLTGPNSKTGICLSLIQNQPKALWRVATMCVYAYMLGYSDMADELLTRALTVNEATRKWLENVCQSLEVARRAEHVLEQWQKSLMKDIQAWMKAHDIPIASSNPVDDNRKNAFKNAYDGEFNALRSLIEENIDKLPPGVDALQFKVNRHGLPLWQERGLQKLITSKQLGIRINTDAQQWPVECDTTDGLVAKFLEPLPRKELLMQRYGCRFVFGIHVCTTCQYTKCIKALLACATLYRLLDISLNGLPRETIVDELYEDGLLVEHADVANLAITLNFSQMCSLRQKLGYACDYQLHEDQAGHWVANMDIGN